ncbi:MAG: hypothetical protein Kow0037_32170 [Calditrichia bacterium]
MKTVILITRDGMGEGPAELTRQLLKKYLDLLGKSPNLPEAICFYANGVKNVVEGSPVLDELRLLLEKGVEIVACSTCLNFYEIIDKVKVGDPGGMPDIIEFQQNADKVITI